MMHVYIGQRTVEGKDRPPARAIASGKDCDGCPGRVEAVISLGACLYDKHIRRKYDWDGAC